MELLCHFILYSMLFCSAWAGINERHLLNHLLGSYNPLERPVANENDTLNVLFGITLQQIIDVDEKNQILISNLWLKFQWIDVNLQWNPEEYGGIETLRISTDRIWIPDVLMYNSADERFDSTFRTNVVVNHTGGCLYVPPGVFKSTCHIDITWFPFDDQLCELKFGSWSYNGLSVDLLQEDVSADTSPYLPNGEWVLMRVPSVRTSQYYECCPGQPFIDIKFIIHIKRRTLYYGFNLIIPCIILSSMTLLSFSLPPESGEKLHLGVTILLSMTVFLVQLSKILPATSDSISIIALYFGSIMVMVAVSVVMTVVVLNFHHRSYETKEMGPKLRKFLLDWLPRLLRMDRPGIKPPKQCIKKVSSKQKLAAAFVTACGSRGQSARTTPTMIEIPQQQPLGGTAVKTTAPSAASSGQPLIPGNEDGQTGAQPQTTTGATYCISHGHHPHHPHLFIGTPPDGVMERVFQHENNCIYSGALSSNHHHGAATVAGAQNSDSMDITKTDEISLAGGHNDHSSGQEDDDAVAIEVMDDVDDLDMEVSITLNNKADDKMKQNRESMKEHSSHHHYMAMKRRHKLLEILIEMRFITDRLRQEDQIKELISEWRYGATVLDRLCLILFTLFTLLSLAICLISAPQLIV